MVCGHRSTQCGEGHLEIGLSRSPETTLLQGLTGPGPELDWRGSQSRLQSPRLMGPRFPADLWGFMATPLLPMPSNDKFCDSLRVTSCRASAPKCIILLDHCPDSYQGISILLYHESAHHFLSCCNHKCVLKISFVCFLLYSLHSLF